jgi:hypothetical protein
VEILAISLFIAIIAATWKGSGKSLAFYDYYILCALGWFLLQAVYETIYLAATLNVTTRQELLNMVATWQGPLREIQIHGFALLMILGVSQDVSPLLWLSRARSQVEWPGFVGPEPGRGG